jgi:hypothetical protein
MQIRSSLRPPTTANPQPGRGGNWHRPNLALLSVAVALAITISMATAGTFPQAPYSTLLLLALAAALAAVLKP